MNKEFDRCFGEFNTAELNNSSIVRELFRLWTLPGQVAASGQNKSLRLAVRAGYLNFYICGQSVALVKLNKRTHHITLKIHQKYYDLVPKKDKMALGKDTITLTGDALNPPDAAKIVAAWVECAYSYRGAEKVFVDALIAQNPNVLDVEMGLPGDEEMLVNGRKTAPRMDVVTVADQDGQLCLNFWEAKCAFNKELRKDLDIILGDPLLPKGSKVGAPVAHQLQYYMAWLDLPEREGQAARRVQVAQAYQDVAKILVGLAKTFDKDMTSPACQTWARLSEVELLVVSRPGVVIGNYYTGAETEKHKADRKKAEIKNDAASFKGKHRDRLTSLGLTVLEINTPEQSHELPSLQDGPLALKGSK